MLRKYKHFLIGFLVGALLFTFIPANAAVQEYILQKSSAKITVDGVEFTDDSLPILYYKGYNYIPAAVFRGICEKLGLGFDWVRETNEIQIQTKGDEKRVEESRPIEGATIEYKAVNGKEYVSMADVKAYCKELYGGRFGVGYGKNDPTWAEIRSIKGVHAAIRPISEEELIKSGVIIQLPIEHINGETHITRETFENIVLPFIDKWEKK